MPDWRRRLQRRLGPLRLDPAREAEVIEEIAQHLQDRYTELRDAGASHEAASRDAAAQIGRLARELVGIEPRTRAASEGGTMVGSLWQDLRYAVRTSVKRPGFGAVVILTLALGIGATTAVFSALDGVLLRPLPYADVERILTITEQTTAGHEMSVSWPDFQDWVTEQRVFEHLGVYRFAPVNLTGSDQAERLNAAMASSEMFGAMGVAPLAGRVFSADEDRSGSDRVAIISERLWRSRFNGDAGMVGRTVVLGGQAHTIVGIMPAAMRFPSRLTDVWLPPGPFVASFPPRGAHPGLTAVGKMKPGVTLQQARADMDAIARRLAQRYPSSNKTTRVTVEPYADQVVRNVRPALLALMAAVAFVLLIGCANLANLMLSKAEDRHREIAIRAALGAGRWRILQQLLVESLLLSGAGGALGAALASWAVKGFVASQPTSVPRFDLIAVDGRVLIFTAAISIATGIGFGLAPAVRASSPDLLSALRRSAGGTSRRFRSALVVAEVALALVLAVSAGLMIRSFTRLIAVDPGFNPEHVVTLRLALSDVRYPDRASWTAFHVGLLRRFVTLPGIEAVGLNSAIPLEGRGSEAPVLAEGDPMPTPDRPATTTLFQTTSADYFRAMGIPIVKGRPFTERDTADSAPVVIVDETLVRRLFHGVDPIGRRISFELGLHASTNPQPVWREIVGVARHVRHYGLASEPPFVQLYTPIGQLPVFMQPRGPAMALVVRTRVPPETVAASIRRELASIDRDVPLYGLQTMQEYLSQDTEQQRLSVMLLGSFGGLALVLAVIGIYGVLSYTVTQRAAEIGIRIALGATRRDVLTLIVGYGTRLSAIGIAIGLAASLVATRSLTALLFEVSPRDPATFAALATLLGAVALVASVVPGLRATRIAPIDALRRE